MKPFTCPFNGECHGVITSKYSVFLGVPLEILGMLYYGSTVVAYSLFILFPLIIPYSLIFFMVSLSVVSLLFSGYLVLIQWLVLRQWCTWCLFSAFLSLCIFMSVVLALEFGFFHLLDTYREFLTVFHIIAATLGVGGATITDVFFFKFIRDLKISSQESDVMHTLSQIIWFAIIFLAVTGLGLYFPHYEELNRTPEFIIGTFVFIVIVINGIFLNLYISPHLERIAFGREHDHHGGELRRFRRQAFASGAISISSWYSALILGRVRFDHPNIYWIFFAYLTIVVITVLFSQVHEAHLDTKSDSEKQGT